MEMKEETDVQASAASGEARGGDHPRRACCFQVKLAGDPDVYLNIWEDVQ
jgi:hypothetical protein